MHTHRVYTRLQSGGVSMGHQTPQLKAELIGSLFQPGMSAALYQNVEYIDLINL